MEYIVNVPKRVTVPSWSNGDYGIIPFVLNENHERYIDVIFGAPDNVMAMALLPGLQLGEEVTLRFIRRALVPEFGGGNNNAISNVWCLSQGNSMLGFQAFSQLGPLDGDPNYNGFIYNDYLTGVKTVAAHYDFLQLTDEDPNTYFCTFFWTGQHWFVTDEFRKPLSDFE